MNIKVEITDDTRRRVAALAERTGMTESEIVAAALEQGHSLAWQERFVEKIARGVAAADNGDFASASDVERVRSKYRSS